MNNGEILTTYTVDISPGRRFVMAPMSDLNTPMLVLGLISVFANQYIIAVWVVTAIASCVVTCEHIGNNCKRRSKRLELYTTRRYRRFHADSHKHSRSV